MQKREELRDKGFTRSLKKKFCVVRGGKYHFLQRLTKNGEGSRSSHMHKVLLAVDCEVINVPDGQGDDPRQGHAPHLGPPRDQQHPAHVLLQIQFSETGNFNQ
jgi:hypothetical protein